MGWSVAPDLSLQELGRTFTYLAVFTASAIAARRLPGGARPLLVGILLAALAVCLWAFATRVWPASLGGEVLGPRLGAPFDYWNALGGMAALAVPATLWLGARRGGSPLSAALAYPALGTLLLTMLLAQSRGALAGAMLAALALAGVRAAPPAHRPGAARGLRGGRPRGRVGAGAGRLHRTAPAARLARGGRGHLRRAVRSDAGGTACGRIRGRTHPLPGPGLDADPPARRRGARLDPGRRGRGRNRRPWARAQAASPS